MKRIIGKIIEKGVFNLSEFSIGTLRVWNHWDGSNELCLAISDDYKNKRTLVIPCEIVTEERLSYRFLQDVVGANLCVKLDGRAYNVSFDATMPYESTFLGYSLACTEMMADIKNIENVYVSVRPSDGSLGSFKRKAELDLMEETNAIIKKMAEGNFDDVVYDSIMQDHTTGKYDGKLRRLAEAFEIKFVVTERDSFGIVCAELRRNNETVLSW